MYFSKPLIALMLLAGVSGPGYAQIHQNRYIKEAIDTMTDITARVRSFESFGTKMIGSTELRETADWLEAFYQNYEYQVSRDTFTYLGHELFNIIAEKKSTNSNAPWLLVIAHYDTRNGPGANDNGSGVAACMEIAKAVSALPDLKLHVRIIHFSSEEFGLAGSYHYVQNSLKENIDEIKLVFNLDQLGGSKGADNNQYIYCERNPSDPYSVALTDTLAWITRSYSRMLPVISTAFSSDYIPFQQEGYVINGLYQFSTYPQYHSADDRLENMDTFWLQEAAKAALAYVLYMAAPVEWTLSASNFSTSYPFGKLYLRSSTSELMIEGEWLSVEITDISGRTICRIHNENKAISVGFLSAGQYLARLKMQDGSEYSSRFVKN